MSLNKAVPPTLTCPDRPCVRLRYEIGGGRPCPYLVNCPPTCPLGGDYDAV